MEKIPHSLCLKIAVTLWKFPQASNMSQTHTENRESLIGQFLHVTCFTAFKLCNVTQAETKASKFLFIFYTFYKNKLELMDEIICVSLFSSLDCTMIKTPSKKFFHEFSFKVGAFNEISLINTINTRDTHPKNR